MDEKQLNRALANLTDDNECWIAIDHLLTESKNHATLVALDVAVKGEDRTWQCGYAQALGDIHRTLEKRRKEDVPISSSPAPYAEDSAHAWATGFWLGQGSRS